MIFLTNVLMTHLRAILFTVNYLYFISELENMPININEKNSFVVFNVIFFIRSIDH